MMITASGGESVPSGTDREISPRTVGGKRRKGEAATRKSTRQRRGVDKNGGSYDPSNRAQVT